MANCAITTEIHDILDAADNLFTRCCDHTPPIIQYPLNLTTLCGDGHGLLTEIHSALNALLNCVYYYMGPPYYWSPCCDDGSLPPPLCGRVYKTGAPYTFPDPGPPQPCLAGEYTNPYGGPNINYLTAFLQWMSDMQCRKGYLYDACDIACAQGTPFSIPPASITLYDAPLTTLKVYFDNGVIQIYTLHGPPTRSCDDIPYGFVRWDVLFVAQTCEEQPDYYCFQRCNVDPPEYSVALAATVDALPGWTAAVGAEIKDNASPNPDCWTLVTLDKTKQSAPLIIPVSTDCEGTGTTNLCGDYIGDQDEELLMLYDICDEDDNVIESNVTACLYRSSWSCTKCCEWTGDSYWPGVSIVLTGPCISDYWTIDIAGHNTDAQFAASAPTYTPHGTYTNGSVTGDHACNIRVGISGQYKYERTLEGCSNVIYIQLGSCTAVPPDFIKYQGGCYSLIGAELDVVVIVTEYTVEDPCTDDANDCLCCVALRDTYTITFSYPPVAVTVTKTGDCDWQFTGSTSGWWGGFLYTWAADIHLAYVSGTGYWTLSGSIVLIGLPSCADLYVTWQELCDPTGSHDYTCLGAGAGAGHITLQVNGDSGGLENVSQTAGGAGFCPVSTTGLTYAIPSGSGCKIAFDIVSGSIDFASLAFVTAGSNYMYAATPGIAQNISTAVPSPGAGTGGEIVVYGGCVPVGLDVNDFGSGYTDGSYTMDIVDPFSGGVIGFDIDGSGNITNLSIVTPGTGAIAGQWPYLCDSTLGRAPCPDGTAVIS